ncbi:MAG: hypothetical protein U0835_03495 [Isosphaeraceae bacterium]
MRRFLGVVVAGCLGFVVMSAFPGLLEAFVLPVVFLVFLAIPASFIALPVAAVLFFRWLREPDSVKGKEWLDDDLATTRPVSSKGQVVRRWVQVLGLSFVLVLGSFGLALSRWPVRVGFAASRPAFERYLPAAPPPGGRTRAGESLGWFGIYRVDVCARDERGGVFFRTGTGPDGVGPDRESYGFAYRPNTQGTPFGRAGYRLRRLAGDWYIFSVSDDY